MPKATKNRKATKNSVFFYGSLASVLLSIIIFQSDPIKGIFVGLWAPTFFILSSKFSTPAQDLTTQVSHQA